MTEKFSRYDTADYLSSEEEMDAYLQVCAEDDDPQLLVAALGDIARARNMATLANEAGLSRAGLYKALSDDGNPSFATVTKIAKALGFTLTFRHSA